MRSAVRIAVVWQSTTPVEALCRAVANARPTANVAVFHDPVADGETIRRLQPSVLVAALDAPDSESAGALRMLRALLGGIGVVLLAPAARLSEARVLAGKLEAQLLPLPPEPAALDAALEAALRPSPSEPQALLNLTRGISDEVNNPLLAALGQLRLLEVELADDEAKLAKVRAATRSLRRIQATLERARAVQRSSELPATLHIVDLGELLREVAGGDFPPAAVRGDRQLLRTALRDLAAVGRDLIGEGRAGTWALTRRDQDVIVRLELPATRLSAWQLPRTFEPYYLSRLLRGTSHGLSLFTVQQIVTAHGGRARARRHGEHGLAFELVLPGAADARP